MFPDFPITQGEIMNIVIGLITILGGVFFYYMGASFRKQALDSQNWIQTNGIVTASKIKHTVSHGNVNHWEPNVEYSYHVENKEYIGSQMVIGPTGTLPWLATADTKQYPVGASIRVFYNPRDHSESVLKPGVTKGINVSIAVGLLVIAVGIAELFGFIEV